MRIPGYSFFQRAVGAARARSATLVERYRAKARKAELLEAGSLTLAGFLETFGLPADAAEARSALEKRRPPPLLPDPRRSAAIVTERLPAARAAALADAALARDRVFDLLGSGPVQVPDWHLDWKTGTRWPTGYFKEIPIKVVPGGPEDVKMPWELSRFYHASALGRASALTGDATWARALEAQVRDWTEKNPFAGSCNWLNAMEVALRSVGWLVGGQLAELDAPFFLELHRQLVLHGRFIVRNLEVYGTVTSNHFLSDVVGLLCIAHALPESAETLAWRAQAEELVLREMQVQVREDGVDYENAVAYHRLVVELFLLAFLRLRLSRRPVPGEFSRRLEKMFEYVLHYTKPDGTVPWVGDQDDGRALLLGPLRPLDDHRYLLGIGAALFGRADMKLAAGPLPEPLVWLLGEEGVASWDRLSGGTEAGSRHFAPSRIAVLRSGGSHAYFEAGDVGIGGRGSHGHDDALSVELSLAGESFVRDAGSFVYTADPKKRFLARSIRSHNTVVVDGAEASGLREDTLWMTPDEQPARIDSFTPTEVVGTHEGYEKLGITHRRRVVLRADGFLVEDKLDGTGEHVFRWQMLTPFLDARVDGENRFVVKGERATLTVTIAASAKGEARVEPAVISPSYGVEREARRLVFEARARAPFEVSATFVT